MHEQEKNKKIIDPQNKAGAEPEGSQQALHIKHIHLNCTVAERFANVFSL